MATLFNQGTLLFTPAGGSQTSVVTNTTSTDLTVSYGLQVLHGAYPETFGNGDTILYTVVLRNIGSGTLVLPTVTVDLGGSALSYVPGSAAAFLYDGTALSPYPFTVSGGSVVFSFSEPLPAGASVLLFYQATVNESAGETVISTATGVAYEGVATGPAVSDSDTATITRMPISIVKSAPDSAEVGDSISYLFTITNNTGESVALDQLTDQLPAQFTLTGVTLTVGGSVIPLAEGTDYTLTAAGLLTVDPTTSLALGAGETVVLAVNGVVTA
ncbi:MAG: DUF11 domain-containing protein [Ruminococcaceae bacterium]|nr:DUF11 domain-containing protein [Oscillospiraceae bacterium]